MWTFTQVKIDVIGPGRVGHLFVNQFQEKLVHEIR